MNELQKPHRLSKKLIVGIDEVGRGSWAGPLVVGAVILNNELEGLADSKLVAKANRHKIATLIKQNCLGFSTGWVTASEIDLLGLTKATTLAIERSIESIKVYDQIIIDGSINYLSKNLKAVNIVNADEFIPAVSAASIIAKVARDDYMAEQALIYPGYGFENHVGYGTARHRKAIVALGITPLHRTSYKPVIELAGAR